MTVRELIKELQKLDSDKLDLQVYIYNTQDSDRMGIGLIDDELSDLV